MAKRVRTDFLKEGTPKVRRMAFAIVAGLLASEIGQAEELRILTSMPESIFLPYEQAFEALHPDVEILVLNKNTNAAVEEVLRGNQRGFGIFWASAPEAFLVLADRGMFTDDQRPNETCKAVGPDGYEPFALSSIGWARRPDLDLFMPARWDDLLLPLYRERIGMARPSRSGTTHMFVERFLQVRGWDEGWAYLLRLSENLSTLTSRSFGVIDGISTGRFDIGITVDFLAIGAEPALDFRYGAPIMIFPAQIGLLRIPAHSELACEFAGFVLSDEGQRLLTGPGMRRIPASAAIRREQNARIPDEIENAIRLSWLSYNPDLARERYWAVNTLFDIFISDILPERRTFGTRLRALEKALPGKLIEIRHLRQRLVSMPVSESQASRPELNAVPSSVNDFTVLPVGQSTALEQWIQLMRTRLAEVDAELRVLESQVQQ